MSPWDVRSATVEMAGSGLGSAETSTSGSLFRVPEVQGIPFPVAWALPAFAGSPTRLSQHWVPQEDGLSHQTQTGVRREGDGMGKGGY